MNEWMNECKHKKWWRSGCALYYDTCIAHQWMNEWMQTQKVMTKWTCSLSRHMHSTSMNEWMQTQSDDEVDVLFNKTHALGKIFNLDETDVLCILKEVRCFSLNEAYVLCTLKEVRRFTHLFSCSLCLLYSSWKSVSSFISPISSILSTRLSVLSSRTVTHRKTIESITEKPGQ